MSRCSLIGCIKLIHVKEWDEDTNKYSACELTVHLKDGSILERNLANAMGDPEIPIPPEDQIKRFKSLVSICDWSAERTDAVINTVLELPQIEDCEELMCNL